MARYTVEQASAMIWNSDDEQSDIDESGSEIDEDPDFPLPHSGSDDQDPQSEFDSENEQDLPPPCLRSRSSPPHSSPSTSPERESGLLSARGKE